MNKFLKSLILTIVIISILSSPLVYAIESDVTPQVAAALFIQIAGLEKNLYGKGEITVYVVGSSKMESELRKIIGLKVGESTLKTVRGGSSLPNEVPDCLFIGSKANLKKCLDYTHTNQIMSITYSPKMVEEGVSLGFGVGNDNKLKVIINMTNSKAEGLDWSQAVLNIARVIE